MLLGAAVVVLGKGPSARVRFFIGMSMGRESTRRSDKGRWKENEEVEAERESDCQLKGAPKPFIFRQGPVPVA